MVGSYSLRMSRIAVLGIFLIHGAILANWVTRIPNVRTNIGLSEGSLGLVLLGISTGVIIGLLMAGGIMARFGSKSSTIAASVLSSASLILVSRAGSFWMLFMALFVMGYLVAVMDMAMNTQAAEVERRMKKPIMSSFHAAFSVGGVVGALMGAHAVNMGFSISLHFTLAALLFIILSFIGGLPLLHIEEEIQSGDNSVIRFPSRALWGLGAVAFSSTIGEGSMADWSALYLTEIVHTSDTVAAFGFASFATLMTVGRISGDWLALRYKPDRLVQGGGLIASLGLLLAMLLPQTIPVLIGFALVGAGLSIIVPITFSAAGNMPGIPPGTGIAGVATIGYAGFLAGPPLIGLIAEVTSLRLAMGIVLILVATLIWVGRSLQQAQIPHS